MCPLLGHANRVIGKNSFIMLPRNGQELSIALCQLLTTRAHTLAGYPTVLVWDDTCWTNLLDKITRKPVNEPYSRTEWYGLDPSFADYESEGRRFERTWGMRCCTKAIKGTLRVGSWATQDASQCASATPFHTPVHQISASVGRYRRVLSRDPKNARSGLKALLYGT